MGVKDCLNHANILLSLLIIEAGHISTPWENSESTGLAGKVSEVHVSQNISPDVLLEHSVPSSCLVPPDSFTLSNDNVAKAIQTANVINPAVLKEQNQVDIQVASLNLSEVTSAIGTDGNETKRQNELKSSLQQTVANLETKLCTAEEEKIKTKKELEYLLEENSILEMNFLKDKKEKLLKYQDHYKMIQLLQGFTNKQNSFIQENLNVEKHKQELEDMRRAGHEALSIIVEEFKHQRLLDILEAEKEVLSEKIEEALMQQSQKHKEVLDKCLDEERERSKETVAAAMQTEKKIVEEAVLKAVEEERRNMEKIHEEERKMWEAERDRHKEKIAQAVQEAIQEQRKHNQEIVKEALMEEQKRSEKAIEEAVKRTREELLEYIKEQKRLDQVVRQRNLSSLELFLSCAQKQLSILLNEDPTTTEEKRD
ncbi:coiled-coil domain-containing protein 91 isoform X6 [Anas platyrhynchos]|uniref:coiled-coil domain-containing protein 91 isoform X6 n=1 Tax=Anas platyrhynchos TaxID=8839 RepID=UPI00065E3360|eukprot:XP_027312822.1 coiled-coil domain-containing protein 91 isoform X6 [Anas platyrhynchos]